MVVQKTAFAFKIKNWLTRISIQYHKATISTTLGQLRMLQHIIAE